MKKYIGTALLVFLVACGQGESEDNQEAASLAANSTNNPENSIEDEENVPANEEPTDVPDNALATTSLEIPADNRDTAADLIDEFVAEEITSDEYGDFYFEFTKPERMGEPVLLVTSDVNDVATALADFAESNSDSTSTQTVHVDQVAYSVSYLNNARDRIVDNYPAFFENESAFLGISVNVVANSLDIYARTVEEVNMDALEEAFGQTDFLTFSETPLGDMSEGEIPIPVEEPEYSGNIEEIDDTVILIDELIYLGTSEAIIVDSLGEITVDDLQLGDYVHTWTTGNIDASLPAGGSAVFIQRIDE
ncbi:hypothetical protein FLK61_24620 [Paenalkalicoccus suaedae]|uniref:DUF3221 domain-containing protein n=1 Tax=Paenalkalicoccus suaedae TaxID=2592382 RepID=A0A859F9U5_9BACI|nr:hypothetical protein [Paenalkalicoccus suaedae]QKS69963.1 hypothetical protein FLK61_24620 [Paenalkalicoccus suaedae]